MCQGKLSSKTTAKNKIKKKSRETVASLACQNHSKENRSPAYQEKLILMNLHSTHPQKLKNH